MENESRVTSHRFSSVSAASEFSQCEDDIDDPISAYFKKRCKNSAKGYFRRHTESDSDSSVGLIDVDNVSIFDEEEEYESAGPKARTSFPVTDTLHIDKRNGTGTKYPDVSSTSTISDPKSHLDRQRLLAQKALLRCNKVNDTTLNDDSQVTHSKDSHVLLDLSNRLNSNLQLSKETEKNWFQPNYSPNTPKYFNDELSSFGGEDSGVCQNEMMQSITRDSLKENVSARQSLYAKQMNSLLKDINQLNTNLDLEFKSQSEEEQINQFEEDEKLCKLENSGLLHNSGISHFSGVIGGEMSRWSSESSINRLDPSNKKLSIGQFFNMRSNRVSSLVGSSAGSEKGSLPSTPGRCDKGHTSFGHDQSLPVGNVSRGDTLKPRRCLSTYDLKPVNEVSRCSRNSNDSSTSNSTLLIQNIIAEMESGLSGTQIYEKLLKNYGLKKKDGQSSSSSDKRITPEPGELPGDRETPKTSKNPKKVDNGKRVGRDHLMVQDKAREMKNFNGRLDLQRSPISPVRESKEPEQGEQDVVVVAEAVPSLREDLNSNQSITILRQEKIKRLKGPKGFDASTPKVQHVKNQDERFKTACNKVLMEETDWEAPRVSSIQPTLELTRTETSEDAEKTLTVNSASCSDLSKRNNTVVNAEVCTIEDTIVAGDLTILSQRIEEMKEDGVCIVRSTEPEEPVLLTVVQKLADLPKGTVDCSALTPLLRDQFPELLSTFPTPSTTQTFNRSSIVPIYDKTQNLLVSEPGSWVKLPARIGFVEKVYIFAEVKKKIFVPLSNVSKNWLLVSVESVQLIHSNGNKLPGVKKNDEWNISDFVLISMKDTVIAPESQLSLQVFVTPKVVTKVDLKVTLNLRHLLGKSSQSRCLYLRTNNINPLNSLNVIPKDSINFGVIADQCFDHRTVQVTFDGICELPLTVYIEEEGSQYQHFHLKPLNVSAADGSEGERQNRRFHHLLHEGEKQLLEFQVFFQPNALLTGTHKCQEFSGQVVVKIGSDTESDGVLNRISVKGSVSFAKFLWNPACTPFVFRLSDRGTPMTRAFPLKNVGSLPIAFSVRIENDETKSEENDGVFTAPKSFYLSRNEESAIDVTFKPGTSENYVKRLMTFQIKPNGRANYEVELIGIINSGGSRPVSRMSNGSTKSLPNTESAPVKLLTTTQSLSWSSVPLEKEIRQTFHLKNASNFTATVRITFKNDLGSFKLVNENGEKVQKIRKVLKPECPFTLTVAFRPNLLGPHHNALFIQTNQLSGKKMISLNGIGGMPNLFIGNVKSDLNGCKMVVLQNSSNANGQMFSNTVEFKNGGRIPGFILVKPSIEVLSLSHELTVSPSCCVLAPDSKVVVKLTQKLKNDDLRLLLSGKDISKIATLSIVMGDEPGRLRLRKLVESGKLKQSERSKLLTCTYENEKEMNLSSFEDSPAFESQFLKGLKVVEVAVVIERSSGVCEPTILLDEDETIDEFVTICSAADTTMASTIILDNQCETEDSRAPTKSKGKSTSFSNTIFSIDTASSHNKITKWLETLEYPMSKH